MDLKKKKLLYLGGIPRARYVVKRAQELGIYVIVADYTENNPAKEIADEAVLVDALDVDALERLCREKGVDGIFSGYVDVILPVWKELCKRLGLPCYIEENMLLAATDKDFFKFLCNKYGVPVPQTYHIDHENIAESAKALPFPVFVKPLDASGSRGAGVCYDERDFLEKYEYAMSFSKKGLVTVEDFLQGTEFILDYIIIDGNPRLASLADRYSIEGRPAAVNNPNLMILPSKFLDRYYNEVDPFVCNMFRQEGFKDGVIFLQGYAGKRIAFYEMGSRLGGTWPFIDEYYHGINPMDMLFSHALTGKMITGSDKVNISARFNGRAAIIYFLSSTPEGAISHVTGVEEAQSLSYVVSVMQYYHAGDSFTMRMQTDVLFLAVHLVAEDFTQLKERVNYLYSIIGYYDADGNSLLSPVYDVEKLTDYE